MIYYILLIIAALLFSAQFMVVKAYEKDTPKTVNSAARFSAFSGFFTFLIFFTVNGFHVSFSWFSIALALCMALISIFINFLGVKILSMGDIAVYSLFMMLGGMILPFLAGIIFLGEPITVWNVIGVVLLIGALVLPVFDTKKKSKKCTKLFYVLCVLLFILNGVSSIITKLHQVDVRGVPTSDFVVLIYGMQCIFSTVVSIATGRLTHKNGAWQKINLRTVICGLLFAIVSGTAYYLQLRSAIYVNATALFPIISGGTLVFSAILGAVIYKEKPSVMQIAQVAVAFGSMFLFML